MSPRRLGAAVLAAAAIAAAAGWAALPDDGSRASAAESVDASTVRAARQYRATEGLDARMFLSPRQIRAWVAGRDDLPPLPAGGNFNGIKWERLAGQVSLADADAMMQYNARCQWRRALQDGRTPGTARLVIDAASSWPALRGLDESAPGQPEGSVLPCYASHDREVRHAQSLGLTPST